MAPTKTSGGDVWAIALSADESYLACTTSDGRIHVWDVNARERIQTYETGSSTGGGSFALAVDLSRDGKLTASGHESGAVYVFNNDAGRMAYSLSGKLLACLVEGNGRWDRGLTAACTRSGKARPDSSLLAWLQTSRSCWQCRCHCDL